MDQTQLPSRDGETLVRRLWRLTDGDRLYFLSFSILMVSALLSTSFYYGYFDGKPYMFLQIICVALLAGYEWRNGIRNQNWIALIIAGALSLLSWRVSVGNLQRLVSLMFPYIYCARRIPFAKIARTALNLSIVTVSFIVLSGLLGIIENMSIYQVGRLREFLGFRYVLYPSGILLNMTALWVYLKKDTVNLTGTLIWAAVNLLTFLLTNGRTSFVMAEILLFGGYLIARFPKLMEKLKPLWILAGGAFLLCGLFSWIVVLGYDTIEWMDPVNAFLGGRVGLAHQSLLDYGVSWFGKTIQWIGSGLDVDGVTTQGIYNYVDCLYVKVVQRYGILFSLTWMGLICWGMWRMIKRKEYQILLISATVAVHCIFDDLSMDLHYNLFWMALGMVLINPSTLNWNGKTTEKNTPAD